MKQEVIDQIKSFSLKRNNKFTKLLIAENLEQLIEYFPYMPDIITRRHPKTGDNLIDLLKNAVGLKDEYKKRAGYIVAYARRNFFYMNIPKEFPFPVLSTPTINDIALVEEYASFCKAFNSNDWEKAHSELDTLPISTSPFRNIFFGADCFHANLGESYWFIIRMVTPENVDATLFSYALFEKASKRALVATLAGGIDLFSKFKGSDSAFNLALIHQDRFILGYIFKHNDFAVIFSKVKNEPLDLVLNHHDFNSVSLELLISKGYDIIYALTEVINQHKKLKSNHPRSFNEPYYAQINKSQNFVSFLIAYAYNNKHLIAALTLRRARKLIEGIYEINPYLAKRLFHALSPLTFACLLAQIPNPDRFFTASEEILRDMSVLPEYGVEKDSGVPSLFSIAARKLFAHSNARKITDNLSEAVPFALENMENNIKGVQFKLTV